MEYVKAIPGGVGIQRAIEIWKILDIENIEGESPRALTEEEISIKTWEGCTIQIYKENTFRYKRLNTAVMEELRRANEGKEKIIRWKRKLCKPDNFKLRQSVHWKVNQAAGFLSHAQRSNLKNELKIDVYSNVITTTIKALKNEGFTADESKDIIVSAVKARQMIEDKSNDEIKREITEDILGVLDGNKQITYKDEEMVEKFHENFGTEAQKRRKK